ncbi:hypothetical protein [uncultured Desulfovibrio sp.]|uniref:hypothetical protein n=1 Tax=uncultured Desulfovibrio sp. TaxID=167968 RepID=UPI0026364C24|nr:hypothetical protein [uncultured Desulfovibrio sp.]
MGEFGRIYKSDLTDRHLMAFWDMLASAGREREMTYCMAPLDDFGFVRWMRQSDIFPWIITWKEQPVGIAYLSEMAGKSAKIHFSMLPQGTRRIGSRKLSVIRGFGLYVLASFLWEVDDKGEYLLDTLIGLTPVINTKAVKFIRSCGAQECGIVPGACFYHDTGKNVPGLVTIYTRETVPSWARVL